MNPKRRSMAGKIKKGGQEDMHPFFQIKGVKRYYAYLKMNMIVN